MSINPFVPQWIHQMADSDQAVAFFAYQSLLESVLRTRDEAEQSELAAALGEALTAQAKSGGAGSFRDNAFLAAAALETANPLHPPLVRNHLARLLGYLPVEKAVPPLAAALEDLEAREMARQSLERLPAPQATAALISALNAPGPVFCTGIIASLAARGGPQSLSAIVKAADDPQPEIRAAAVMALGAFPDPSLDAILERHNAPVARARLAATLRSAGNKDASDRIYKSLLAGNAPEAQKKAAHLALQSS